MHNNPSVISQVQKVFLWVPRKQYLLAQTPFSFTLASFLYTRWKNSTLKSLGKIHAVSCAAGDYYGIAFIQGDCTRGAHVVGALGVNEGVN